MCSLRLSSSVCLEPAPSEPLWCLNTNIFKELESLRASTRDALWKSQMHTLIFFRKTVFLRVYPVTQNIQTTSLAVCTWLASDTGQRIPFWTSRTSISHHLKSCPTALLPRAATGKTDPYHCHRPCRIPEHGCQHWLDACSKWRHLYSSKQVHASPHWHSGSISHSPGPWYLKVWKPTLTCNARGASAPSHWLLGKWGIHKHS